ncbi:carboxypeptidase-like regulatory domain-containing protein [Paenibacillus illinoisensis]|uniref:carboxypeptidase-like regulatory domain-containing protein n=1 Tax=Paenibacillus illinoisensis TaxID=59845 RepID=UPI003D97EFFA
MFMSKCSGWIVRTCIMFIITILLGVAYSGTSYAAKIALGPDEGTEQQAVLYGKISDLEEFPIEGAILSYTLSYQDEKPTNHTAITDQDGNYRIVINIEEGKGKDIFIRIDAEGYVGNKKYSTYLRHGEHREVNFWLYEPSTIIGNVKNQAGKPIVGAQVVVGGWAEPVTIKTDSNGRFIVTDIDAEWPNIWVSVNSEDYLPYEQDRLGVEFGRTLRLDIELNDAAHVRGQVFDEQGNPVKGAKITSQKVTSITDDEGNYILKRIPTGKASITVEGAGYLKQMVTADLVPGDNNRINFVLKRNSDTLAPVTKYRLVPINANVDGKSYIKGFIFRLQATDEAMGSGVQTTKYRFNGGQWVTFDGPVRFYAPDVKTVEYYSTDVAGNVEKINKMDFVAGTFEGAGSY